jgi:hypothetical protein
MTGFKKPVSYRVIENTASRVRGNTIGQNACSVGNHIRGLPAGHEFLIF